jgi:hypothetical protein
VLGPRGQQLGKYVAFTIGPMCAINMTSGEPPSHRYCAEWSAVACPFLSRPHAERRDVGLPTYVPGTMIGRNPGVTLVWVTQKPGIFFDDKGRPLFGIGPLESLKWFSRGREATRAEVWDSIETGLPALEELCETDAEKGEIAKGLQYVKSIMPTIVMP